jgi:hypothetical protein
MSNWLGLGLNLNQENFGGSTSIYLVWRIIFAYLTGNDENHGRSRRHGAKNRRWSDTSRVLSGRMIERSGDAVCSLHRAQGDGERIFLDLSSKPRLRVLTGLDSKSVTTYFSIWASKPTATVWWFEYQNHHDNFLIWASKLSDYGLSVVPQNRQEDEDGMWHVPRYNDLLYLKVSRVRGSYK